MIIRPAVVSALSYPCLFVAFAVIVLSCSLKPENDHCCTFTGLAEKDRISNAGKGMLQIDGSTSAYYYVLDQTGQPLKHQHLNKPVVLEPGKYQVKINNTFHTLKVTEGYLAKCSSGTLVLSGQTTDIYYVTDSIGQPLANEKLGRSISVFPGNFHVRVNDTELPVSVQGNQMTEVRTGSLQVQGKTGEYFHVLDASKKQLNFSPLGTPMALLPGRYEVRVNNTSRKAEVFAGRTTRLATGSLLVKGLTDEFYYVADTLGHALNLQKLNKAVAVFPGVYSIQLNNTSMTGEVTAGQITEFTTGCLTLTGPGDAYYYVLDSVGKPLNHNSLNRWLSFFPSDYTVKLGESIRKATIIAGKETSLVAF